MTPAATKKSSRSLPTRLGLVATIGVVVLHAGYALATGGSELADLIAGSAEHELPLVFALHALAGGVALALLPLQLSSQRRTRSPRLHRIGGRVYVIAVLLAAPTAMATALVSDRHTSSWWSFAILAGLWAGTTIRALLAARARRIPEHRRWMTRSAALTAFFITFEPWVGISVSLLPVSHDTAVAIGVTLAWGLNLAAAELWLRRATNPLRTRTSTRAGPRQHIPTDKVNLEDAYRTFHEPWQPRIAARLNDYDVKIVHGEGSLPQHIHADTGEFFLVLEGELTLAMPQGDVVLGPREAYTVPAGTPHAPSATSGTKLVFIEPRGVSNTGDDNPSGTTGHELNLTEPSRERPTDHHVRRPSRAARKARGASNSATDRST